MEIVGADAAGVDIRLVFSRPMAADNAVRFDLTDDGGGTRVTWSMTGETSGLAGLVSRIVPMDRLVGRDFDRGLEQLDAVVTAGAGRGPVTGSRGPGRGRRCTWLGSKA
ncbi:MAG: hypothetical protein PGN29_10560 [Gordonia paraffinivorans]